MNKKVNEFVKYLNSLHRCNGNNTNSTAEANSENVFAGEILVEDETLINKIITDLKTGDGKVLLTGFAGDGKTTLAQIIVRKLIDSEARITKNIQKFDIPGTKRKLIIIKDLSENSLDLSEEIVQKYIRDKTCSLLLVSNSGAIIHRLKSVPNSLKLEDAWQVEDCILEGISSRDKDGFGEIDFGNEIKISVINLVYHDNICTARKILNKIVYSNIWDNIQDNELKKHPILLNVMALRNDFVVDQLFLMYQKLFEYGHRYTLRNFVEHFSYLITGNLNLSDIPMETESYLFYNNVFGRFEYGCQQTSNFICNDITIIKDIRAELFGSKISSSWKRTIWNQIDFEVETSILSPFDTYYSKYRNNSKFLRPTIDRLKLYRVVYFLFQPTNSKIAERYNDYCSEFLNSPGLKSWQKIQTGSLETKEQTQLFNSLRHVIKEYFAGLKLPTNEKLSKDCIYITMNRKGGIKQSAQVVSTKMRWILGDNVALHIYRDFTDKRQFELIVRKSSIPVTMSIEECSKDTESNCLILKLPLPFLDFLLNSDSGNLKDSSYSYFEKRLDCFKRNIIVDRKKVEGTQNDLLLVRLKPDRNLSDIKFRLTNNNRLEVN